MKKGIALFLALILTFTAVPCFAKEDTVVREVTEIVLPYGDIMQVINEIAYDDSMTVEQKYAKLLASIITDAAALKLIPGIKGFLNTQAQELVDLLYERGAFDDMFDSVSNNDKELLNMYLKAADHAIDLLIDKVENVVKSVTQTAEKVFDFFASWF